MSSRNEKGASTGLATAALIGSRSPSAHRRIHRGWISRREPEPFQQPDPGAVGPTRQDRVCGARGNGPVERDARRVAGPTLRAEAENVPLRPPSPCSAITSANCEPICRAVDQAGACRAGRVSEAHRGGITPRRAQGAAPRSVPTAGGPVGALMTADRPDRFFPATLLGDFLHVPGRFPEETMLTRWTAVIPGDARPPWRSHRRGRSRSG